MTAAIPTPTPAPDPGARFDRTILDIAIQVEAAENNIKQAILSAAESGNTDAVLRIMRLWLARPATEVLAATNLSTSSATCLALTPAPEVGLTNPLPGGQSPPPGRG
jgi:hypothetical protein